MKKLVIVTLLTFSLSLWADCNSTLNACKDLVDAQTVQITHLKANQKLLENRLSKEEEPLLPWWTWGVIGIIVGGITVETLHK